MDVEVNFMIKCLALIPGGDFKNDEGCGSQEEIDEHFLQLIVKESKVNSIDLKISLEDNNPSSRRI